MKQFSLVSFLMTIASFFAFTQSQGQANAVTSPDGIRIAYEEHSKGTSVLIFVHG